MNPPRPIADQLRGCLLVVSLGIATVAGVVTLTGFAARADWRLELTCHFRVQYFWLLTLAAIGFWICRYRRLAAVPALLAAVNLALIAPLYWGPARVLPADPQLLTRAISLNVRYLNHDYQAVIDLVDRERPDILVLLEVTPKWIEALSVFDSEYPNSRALPRYDASGLAVYSRLPIEHFEVRGRAEIGLPTMVARVALPQGLLTLFATHPASPGSAAHAAMRNRQLAAVAEWAHECETAAMVLGDLNCTSWSPYFTDLLATSRLLDSRRGFGVEPTWPGLWLPLRIPIDHCLVSPEIAVVARRVGGPVGSDHRPIIVDFWLPRP